MQNIEQKYVHSNLRMHATLFSNTELNESSRIKALQ